MGLHKFIAVGLLLCFLLASSAVAQDAVPTEMLERTWFIKVGSEAGTAFLLDHQDRIYLVTAKHVVAGVPAIGATIQVWQSNQWKNYETVKTLYPPSPRADIAVFETNEKIPHPYSIQPAEGSAGGVTFGQRDWFLGFPFGLGTQFGKKATIPLTGRIPFIKGGTMSAIDARDPEAVILYIDGFNNPGFSGGPIIYWDFSQHKYKILGVVEAYREEAANVQIKGKNVPTPILVNSGILLGYTIQPAIEAIERNEKQP
jgi:hypothetical protein